MTVRISTPRMRAWFPSQGNAPPDEVKCENQPQGKHEDKQEDKQEGKHSKVTSDTNAAGVIPARSQGEAADTLTAQKREEADGRPTARMHADPDERRWLALARQGDVAAFEWLMNRYRDRAIRLAAHILRRPAEAEDLAQEAFIRAFAQIANFRGEAAFYSWLYKIVARQCLNRMRQPHWYREWEPAIEEETAQDTGGSPSPERHADRLLIETLLDALSPPLRAALVLREMEGLDYGEIAETLDIPVGTVRSRLNAARQQFRVLWERAMKEIADV